MDRISIKPSMISTRNLSFINSSVSWLGGVSPLTNGVAWLVVLIGLEIILRHVFIFLFLLEHIAVVFCFI